MDNSSIIAQAGSQSSSAHITPAPNKPSITSEDFLTERLTHFLDELNYYTGLSPTSTTSPNTNAYTNTNTANDSTLRMLSKLRQFDDESVGLGGANNCVSKTHLSIS